MPKTNRTLYLALTGLITMYASTAQAGKEAHGGDGIALEVTALASNLAENMKQGLITVPGVNADTFAKQVRATRIETRDIVICDGTEVDACNYPDENRIEISRPHWTEYGTDLRRKRALVLHEFLGIMRAGDYKYEMSDQLYSNIPDLPDEALSLMVLREIDDKCGDTWCEGDYDYRFYSLRCNASSGCRLDFAMIETDSEEVNRQATIVGERYTGSIHSATKGSYKQYEVSCTLPEMKSLSETIDPYPGQNPTYRFTLSDEFYEQLTDCIWSLEATINDQNKEK
jgi:hypothetical protein